MKTYKNLYPQIHSFENLYLAYKSAARGKRGRPDVAAFEMDLEDNLFQIQANLESQTYAPGPYYHFTIYEPKRRRISAAPFRDRVVHHALIRVIEPIPSTGSGQASSGALSTTPTPVAEVGAPIGLWIAAPISLSATASCSRAIS